MEKKSKAEKLKLRGINQTILISSYNSGAGTGPNDCMTEEVYQRLNAQGALEIGRASCRERVYDVVVCSGVGGGV